MLKSLTIKNYLLIDELSVSFNNGFTVITGETGAGKSVLVGGISLILGKALLIFLWITFLDLKKGPIISNIFPLISEDSLGPIILKIIKKKNWK